MRIAARWLVRHRTAYLQNTLIVGAGDVGQMLARKVLQHPEYRLNVVGFVDDAPKERRDDLGGLTIVATTDELEHAVRELRVERVIIAFSRDSLVRTLDLLRQLGDLGVRVDIVPRFFEFLGPKIRIDWLEAVPLLTLQGASPRGVSRAVKRAIDIVGASVGILLTAPLFAVIAWQIARDSPGPVFFRQKRLGRGMNEFTIFKFRTMRMDTDDAAHRAGISETMKARPTSPSSGLFKPSRDDAITRVGRWLRRTSLDELPQLINVVRGEMSLVGPRPSLPYEVEHFDEHHFERFDFAPGLTGLWQVRGRALTSWREAVEMDVTYVRGWSLGLDLWLLCRTPAQLVRLKTC
jgi:exopolysaccharide biosynthesis polyprenyl glycosylphosphotransferase